MRGLKFIILFFIFFCNSYYSQIFEKDLSVKETERYDLPNLKLSTQNSTQQVMSTAETTLRIIDNGLISTKFSDVPQIFEVTKSLAQQYLNRDMFSYHAPIDMDSYYYSADNYAAFLLDPYWKRIVFSNTSNYDIKSFGDNATDYKFSSPSALAVDFDGNVYVCDSEQKKIIVLNYNYTNNTLNYSTTINVSNLEKPIDIALTQDAQNQKKIWIVDNYNKLLLINTTGTILRQYTGFWDVTTYTNQQFESLEKISVDKTDYQQAMIYENTKKRLIFVRSEPTVLNGLNTTIMPSSCYFTDIGMNCEHEYLVTDLGLNLLHKFDVVGKYVCSYRTSQNFNGFNFPLKISNISKNKPGYTILNYYVENAWDNNWGIRRFLPGSHIFNLAYQKNTNDYMFSWIASDRSIMRIDVFRNEQLIKSYDYPPTSYSGSMSTSILTSELGVGSIKFRVNYKPFRDDNYGEYKQGWKYQEISFTINPPLIASMSGPSYLNNLQTGTWTVTPSGGVPPYSYSWSYYVHCDGGPALEAAVDSKGIITPNAVPCGTWFSIYNTTNTVSRTSDGRTFDLKCVVTDANNSTYTVTKTVTGSGSALMNHSSGEYSIDTSMENEILNESLETYPNPFNPSTKISFSVPYNGHVSLKVYDILGREIAELANKIFSPGKYEFEFDASSLPSGIYISTLVTERNKFTKKMLLVK